MVTIVSIQESPVYNRIVYLKSCCCWVTSVVSNSVRPHWLQPTRLPNPWDYPGKKTVVGCHFLLQCMKVKSESEVAQSCPTLSDPMDCSLPGSSVHGIFQARVLKWGAIAFSALKSSTVKRWAFFFICYICGSQVKLGIWMLNSLVSGGIISFSVEKSLILLKHIF